MCVILYTVINGKKILAKNRDRAYKPKIKLIHELVNGIEIAYIKDTNTGWVEGMDENGFAVVNATLSRSDSKNVSNKRVLYNKTKKNKLLYFLTKKNKKEFLKKLLRYHQKKTYKHDLFLEGHTLMAVDGDKIFHIENNIKNDYVIDDVNKNIVYTNYGVLLKNEGYTKGRKGVSSFLRKKIVEKELKDLDELQRQGKFTCQTNVYDKLSHLLNKNYVNLDPRFHTYRDKNFTMKKNKLNKNNVFINTTAQLIFNVTDKEFVYYNDIHSSKGIEYVNRLPRDTVPKIKVIIRDTEKNIKPHKIFTQKYLNWVYKRFNYHSKTKKKRN
jgi:hypothetical protein